MAPIRSIRSIYLSVHQSMHPYIHHLSIRIISPYTISPCDLSHPFHPHFTPFSSSFHPYRGLSPLSICFAPISFPVQHLPTTLCTRAGKEVTWWSITSTTANISVLESSAFLGKTGARTIFDIQARCLCGVGTISLYIYTNRDRYLYEGWDKVGVRFGLKAVDSG